MFEDNKPSVPSTKLVLSISLFPISTWTKALGWNADRPPVLSIVANYYCVCLDTSIVCFVMNVSKIYEFFKSLIFLFYLSVIEAVKSKVQKELYAVIIIIKTKNIIKKNNNWNFCLWNLVSTRIIYRPINSPLSGGGSFFQTVELFEKSKGVLGVSIQGKFDKSAHKMIFQHNSYCVINIMIYKACWGLT